MASLAPMAMLLPSTTPNLEGWPIRHSLGLVHGERLLGQAGGMLPPPPPPLRGDHP